MTEWGIFPPVFCFCTWSACHTDDLSDTWLNYDWIVTLQEFTIIAVNPLCAKDRYIKHIGLLDLSAVWFMQILLNRFQLAGFSLHSATSVEFSRHLQCQSNHELPSSPNCIDPFISTALFIWKILSMVPCISFMSCWEHKYYTLNKPP